MAAKKHKYRSYGSLSGGEKFAESYRNSQETGLSMDAPKKSKKAAKKPMKRAEKRSPKRIRKG